MAETKKLEVQDYKDREKKPSQLVLLKRIERLVEQLDDAGLAYLRTKLGQGTRTS